MFEEEKKLWTRFAAAALTGCVATLEDRIDDWNDAVDDPQDMVDEDEQIKEDCEYAAQYADRMVALFNDKFENC